MINFLLQEKTLPSIHGRMSTGDFDFNIDTLDNKTVSISVKGSQCEIDGGFEGANKLALVEFKIDKCEDFLIRQLYYPYRMLKNKVKNKDIVPIFCTYNNKKCHFFIYTFENELSYSSIKLIKHVSIKITP